MTIDVRHRLARALAWLERLAERPLAAVLLFALGLGDYAVQALAWPLVAGRDIGEYLTDYVQFLDWHPLLPWPMLFRTPVAPIVIGSSLDVAGGAFAEPVMAILFAGSVLAWSAAARTFGPRVALAVPAALLVYPGYSLMFHELSSDSIFCAGFALWAYLVARAAARPSARRFALVGLGVALVALIRPGNAILLGFVLFPLAVRGSWRARLSWAAGFAVAAVLPLATWAVLNGIRYGDYALARGGNAVVPFYRAFITDRIISPDHGPASRRLANAIQQHLLTHDPYKSYGVTLDEVFKSGSFRIHEDLYNLSDQVFGWNSNYSVLRKAAIEGVEAEPGKYASGVAKTIWQQLDRSYFRTPSSQAPRSSGGRAEAGPTVVVHGRRLPAPTEGQPIPTGHDAWISRPDNSILLVWTSATHHQFVFRDPAQKRRFMQIQRRKNELFANLPDRSSHGGFLHRLNQFSRWYPRSIVWIVLGLVALVVRRPCGSRTLVALALSALLVIVFNALGLFADLHFALPVAPAFILLGLGALLGNAPKRA